MPHKHKRMAESAADYNLPPTTVAKPLPVSKSASTKDGKSGQTGTKGGKSESTKPAGNGANKKRKRNKPSDDDTPKAFARLMAWQKGIKPKSGLDDGAQRAPKKRKTAAQAEEDQEATTLAEEAKSKVEVPKIMPGERMADFSARVDAALPLGKITSRGVQLEGVKRQRTKLEKKITRMQDEWRERDKRMKDKAAEEEEEAEIEAILNGEDGAKAVRILEDPDKPTSSKKKKGKKRKRRKGGNESDDDPWAAVAKARKAAETGSLGLVGVHDVVQEPPRFDVQPKEKFKVRNGASVDVANVPGASGSLRRREELDEARKNVLEGYRSARKGQNVQRAEID